uniref:Protein FAM57Alike [Xiphosphorus maculatus] n=3 Tax=Lepeophtheirus salmonis TaxID=72036 RepID=A0A0K2T711_LEPSM
MSYRQSLGDCLIALGFCMEASTPFVSLRAILYHLGLKSSILYLVNGLLMNIVFFICRILVFPYMYQLYANQCGLTLSQLIFTGKVPLFCNSSMLLLFLPQLYWFSLMLRGSYKVITRILTPKEKV